MGQALNIGVVRYSPWDPEKSFDFFVNVLGFYPQLRGQLEKALYFLTNTLGIDAKGEPDKIFVGCGDTLVEFCRPAPGARAILHDPNASIFGVGVNNLDDTLVAVEVHGAKIMQSFLDDDSFLIRQVVIDVPGGPQISLHEYPDPDGLHLDRRFAGKSFSPNVSPRASAAQQGPLPRALNIGVIPYRSWDPEKSFDFLTNVPGFYPELNGDKVFVRCGDSRLQFRDAAPGAETVPQFANTYVCGVVVDSLDETLAELELHGAEIVRPIWDGNSFWGRQVVIGVPGGPQISLREYREPDGPHFNGWYRENTSS